MTATRMRSIDVVGDILNDRHVVAIITTTAGSGGSTSAGLTIQLYQADGVTKVTSARQVQVIVGTAQHAPSASSAVTFTAASVGTIKAGGAGYRVLETDATGSFVGTLTNSTDGTWYVAAHTPFGVASGDEAKQSSVIGSTSATVVWSA